MEPDDLAELLLEMTATLTVELHPAIAANPFIVFSTLAIESGTLTFHWTGDNGFSVTESAALTVV